MFPEEKWGTLELEGEINAIPEEEDTSDPPTVIMPERQYRQPVRVEEDDILWPFF
jgi:hypothetical protein